MERSTSDAHCPIILQNFEQIFQRCLTVHGFLLSAKPVLEALESFQDEVVPLILANKITTLEHRYSLENAGEAIADLHKGKNTGKAVIIVSEDE